MLRKIHSISSFPLPNSSSPSSNSISVQDLIIQEVQKIKNITILFDKATKFFEHGEYRRAYIYFDICVTADKNEPKFRLSRGICAYKLNVFTQTYDDANISMKLKRMAERDQTSKEIQRQISDILLAAIKADHRRHLARCKYWMAKANFAQGDYDGAIHDLSDSQSYMSSKKADELTGICQERKKQGLSSLFYNTAPSKIKRLFCDEIGILDNQTNCLYHLRSSSSNNNKMAMKSRPILQHPTDYQLPITILGTFAIFDRETFLQEKLLLIQKAIQIQTKDFHQRKLAVFRKQYQMASLDLVKVRNDQEEEEETEKWDSFK